MATQCEVLYVNPLPFSVTGAAPSEPDRVLRVWTPPPELSHLSEDLAFNARYRMLDDAGQHRGRLIASMSTLIGPDNVPTMRLEITAQGAPFKPGLDGILAFHDAGHEAIVHCFAAITTKAMHDRWDRYQ